MAKKKLPGGKKYSMILGILGIIAGLFIPLIGIILGIIGLVMRKEEGHEMRDKVLNILAIVISIIIWIVGVVLWSGAAPAA